MDLSVIIVNWNTRSLLKDCLSSVFSRVGDSNTEVIVVDNGSDDGSTEMVKRDFPDAVLIANDSNRGFAAANNQGLGVAKGRYVLLLNSDTIVHGDVLSRSVKFMDRRPGAGAMGCRVLNADGTIQPSCSRFPSLLNLILLTSGLWKLGAGGFFDRYQMRRWDRCDEREVETISGCYLLVRRDAMHEVGGLDENFFFFGEETDWCRRLRGQGWKVVFAPVGDITHFGGGSSGALNHHRDLMLTSGTVRLHRKHGGLTAAVTAWFILWLFNASRAVFWSVRQALNHSSLAQKRAAHFRAVVASFTSSWPKIQRAIL
jgi:GT2 family glycosyltransferase